MNENEKYEAFELSDEDLEQAIGGDTEGSGNSNQCPVAFQNRNYYSCSLPQKDTLPKCENCHTLSLTHKLGHVVL